MKSFIISLTCLFVLFGCTQQPKSEVKEVSTTTEISELVVNNDLSEASFSITGMTCKTGCAKTIENNLSKMEGVQKASVDFETSLATVLYNPSIVQTDDLTQTVTNTGDSYTVSNMASTSNAKKPACCAKEGCKKTNCAKKKG